MSKWCSAYVLWVENKQPIVGSWKGKTHKKLANVLQVKSGVVRRLLHLLLHDILDSFTPKWAGKNWTA